MSFVSTRDAAARLGVSERQVRNMVKQGRLQILAESTNLLITANSLERAAQTPRRTGRAWTPRIAWAALDLLSGGSAPWLQPAERYRLRQSLKGRSVDEVAAAARNRAEVHRFRAAPEAAQMLLRHHIVPTGGSALANPDLAERFGLASGASGVDGYVGSGTASNLAASLGMEPDREGKVVLREVAFQDALRVKVPVAAVALDLTESTVSREHAAGRRVLEELLAQQWTGEP